MKHTTLQTSSCTPHLYPLHQAWPLIYCLSTMQYALACKRAAHGAEVTCCRRLISVDLREAHDPHRRRQLAAS